MLPDSKKFFDALLIEAQYKFNMSDLYFAKLELLNKYNIQFIILMWHNLTFLSSVTKWSTV